MQKPDNPSGPAGASSISGWARTHLAWTLRFCYILAAVLFLATVILWRQNLIARVLVGFVLARAVLLAAERVAESVFVQHVRSGEFFEALSTPGITTARQTQVLRAIVSDPLHAAAAETVASYVSYAIAAGREDLVSIIRDFEATWGVPPVPGKDSGLVRDLLIKGFRFTTPVSPAPDTRTQISAGIPWRDLWRQGLWKKLRELHPGEALPGLLLRLYATEWQGVLAPLWVLAAAIITLLLSKPWLSSFSRGVLFYSSGVVLAMTAAWLAFILRPGAFNASLLAGDMDRCAHWVLESTEGRHFLVAALGARSENLRRQAVRLLLWNDALLTASVTLPEGMKAFSRREGSARSHSSTTTRDRATV